MGDPVTDLADFIGTAEGDEGCCECLRMLAPGEPYGYANTEELALSAEPILEVVCLDCKAKAS